MPDNVTIQSRTRAQIAAFLPSAIEKAVTSYRQHMEREEQFVTLHKDAKVALAHIELLIKLAKWADLPDVEMEGKRDAALLADLLAEAQAELDEKGDNAK